MENRQRIPFDKMHGSGNDFVLIDHRAQFIPEAEQRQFARRVCVRKIGVGADGLILLENSAVAHFRWRFYNADGSEAEMCGNGGRCAARFAVLHGLAPEKLSFETLAGIIQAEVRGREVKLLMPGVGNPAMDKKIPVDGKTVTGHFIQVGVPHLVVPVTDLEQALVTDWGRKIRFHPLFQPAGTNVNFMRLKGAQDGEIRTYERGVEDETLACGTGAVASALIAARLGQAASPVVVHTRGGEVLTVHFQPHAGAWRDIFLEGSTSVVYRGELWVDELSCN